MLEAYLNELKTLGVYDDSTIIITSDHGDVEYPQIIFFIKENRNPTNYLMVPMLLLL